MQLSVEIGIAQETISAYESGKAMPSVDILCKLANYLHTSTDYLLERTGVKMPVNEMAIDGLSGEEIEVISHFKSLSKEKKNKAIGFIMGLLE
jgi:transcriptional regulator with XRE-family HTH domain